MIDSIKNDSIKDDSTGVVVIGKDSLKLYMEEIKGTQCECAIKNILKSLRRAFFTGNLDSLGLEELLKLYKDSVESDYLPAMCVQAGVSSLEYWSALIGSIQHDAVIMDYLEKEEESNKSNKPNKSNKVSLEDLDLTNPTLKPGVKSPQYMKELARLRAKIKELKQELDSVEPKKVYIDEATGFALEDYTDNIACNHNYKPKYSPSGIAIGIKGACLAISWKGSKKAEFYIAHGKTFVGMIREDGKVGFRRGLDPRVRNNLVSLVLGNE